MLQVYNVRYELAVYHVYQGEKQLLLADDAIKDSERKNSNKSSILNLSRLK